MTNTVRLSAFVVFAFFVGTGGALAQSAGPDEMVTPNGAVMQKLALTPAQKSAIYNAVAQQRVRTYPAEVPGAIGAPVPPSVELSELPDQAAADNPWVPLLTYVIVDDDLVVVDPIRMRVVDVIHGSANP